MSPAADAPPDTSFPVILFLFFVLGLAHSLTEPEVQAVFANAALLSTLATVLKKGKKNADEGKTGDAKDAEGGGDDVRYVVYDGKCEDEVRCLGTILALAFDDQADTDLPPPPLHDSRC
jgi:hypothetical protein